jgi:SagB-type dehydrogenase family enzyme
MYWEPAMKDLDALDYHQGTKHSLYSVRANPHFLDWEIQPLPFKIYTTLEPIPLPADFDAAPAGAASPDLRGLAKLLFYTAGITRVRTFADGYQHHFRAAACTGALYHIDLYVVCADLDGLAAGVYHFGPQDFSLRRLRRGDHRRVVVDASGGEPALAAAPIAIVFASTVWRNAWKYQARAYRHCFWDSGTMLANALAVAGADGTAARVVAGFADAPIGELLGLDGAREMALTCLAIGRGAAAAPATPGIDPIAYETESLSARQVDYPAIGAVHAGSSLADGNAAATWRRRVYTPPPTPAAGPVRRLADAEMEPPRSITTGIRRRGSARRFARSAIELGELSEILRQATAAIPADFYPNASSGADGGALFNEVYLIVNAVEGLAAGAYVYRPGERALELLREGDFRGDAGHLDLGQELAADAAVNFYMLGDLERVSERLGNRGYRVASLEAAIIGGRIYLAAYRLRLGATGLTFFDDDVTDFFAPRAGGRGVLFLTAVGHAAARN